MGLPMMFASAPTTDGQWYSVIVTVLGTIATVIPGLFGSKAEADENARRYICQR